MLRIRHALAQAVATPWLAPIVLLLLACLLVLIGIHEMADQVVAEGACMLLAAILMLPLRPGEHTSAAACPIDRARRVPRTVARRAVDLRPTSVLVLPLRR